jgi:hypothetical protein
MIAPEHQVEFKQVNQVSDFARLDLNLSLVSGWPDVSVMNQNAIPVIKSPDYQSAVKQLMSGKARCFSRSVIEIGSELTQMPELMEEGHMALIYPFADIVYVNPHNPELHKALSNGLKTAIEDRSFYQLHDDHYQQLLINHRFYARKLLIMENQNLTEAALEAINRYGIASFNRLKRAR